MNGYIKAIKGPVPHTKKEVDISLDGRNLIITGGNGSGKTSLLEEIHQNLDIITKDGVATLSSLGYLLHSERFLSNDGTKGMSDSGIFEQLSSNNNKKIKDIADGVNIDIQNYFDYSSIVRDKQAIIRYFTSHRTSSIYSSRGPYDFHDKAMQKGEKFGENLEQHLVNLKARRSFAMTENKDVRLTQDITEWFELFDNNLKILMEDDSTRLNFDINHFKFSIVQQDTIPYTFQTLSSGYSAIFDVFAELLMSSELFDIAPSDLKGVVLIDEIDVHLHVSLQRKILPFLCNSFKNIQFIVTTHSPFIITSLQDIVVYDLTKLEQIDDNLSMYSYGAILHGLLGVPPVSEELQKSITELASLNNANPPDIETMKILMNKIKPYQEQLDDESEMFYHMAVNTVLMSKRKGE